MLGAVTMPFACSWSHMTVDKHRLTSLAPVDFPSYHSTLNFLRAPSFIAISRVYLLLLSMVFIFKHDRPEPYKSGSSPH